MGAGPGRVVMPVPGAAAAACMSSMCWTPPSSESGDISLEGMASCSMLLIVILYDPVVGEWLYGLLKRLSYSQVSWILADERNEL